VQPLGSQDVSFHQVVERAQGMDAGADLVGERRQAEIDTLTGVSIGLAVQRLMLTELLEQHHGEEVRPKKATGCRVERRRRLADLLAFTARDLFANRLDDLPLPRDHLQRLGDVLTQL